MAEQVGVDSLEALWRCGGVLLPQVAALYSEVASDLSQTAYTEKAAFQRSRGGLSPLHGAWTELRNLIQDEIAVKSHDNMMSAGEALKAIAVSFAETDDANARELQRRIDDIRDGERGPRPPEVPDPPSSDENRPAEPIEVPEQNDPYFSP